MSLLKWEKGGLKSPTARARGLGSAKSGVEHWMAQRVTAIGNLVLGLWFLYSIVVNRGMSYTEALLWLSDPINAVAMILFVVCSFYHAVLGFQTVVEDYIHHEGFKIAKLIGIKLVYFALAVLAVFSVLQVAL
jgi:succinate dehydrogenase / fumarate reductase membrane anchor subunit